MRRAALILVVLVVLSGCSSPISAPGGPDSVDPRSEGTQGAVTIAVENGSLPVDHTALYRNVTRMLGVDAEPPTTIFVEPNSEMGIQLEPMDPFFQLVGIDRPASASRTATALGVVGTPQAVHLNEQILSDEAQTRLTLAHEYVHVVQMRTDVPESLRARVPAPRTTDGRLVRNAVLEGAAVSVETRLCKRYGATGTSPAAEMERSYETTSGARQWLYARYHFGYEYVQSRAPFTSIADVYDSPPRTSEELVHGLPRGAEPMPPLSVVVPSDEWSVESRDRAGELFVRVALDTQLSTETAANAAAGWGVDTRVELHDDGKRAYVWALRWDDPANASEFRGAFRTYLEERATSDGDVWIDDGRAFRTVRVENETVVVLLGNESFVRNASVGGSVDFVRVIA
ncbi:MAG: hypothetical protein ABEJ44_01990 [Halanaeroarchaeum sp.]